MKVWGIICLGLVACGDSSSGGGGGDDSGDDAQPSAIARLTGKVEGMDALATNDLRFSLAWFGDGLDPSKRTIVFQEVELVSITNTWPAQFVLDIKDPPPAGAVHYALGYAQAKLVAYRDGNANGRLDATPVLADAFVDTIVAYHPRLYLWFYEDGSGLKLMLPGQSQPVDPSTPITLLEHSEPRASCHALDWTPHFALFGAQNPYGDPASEGKGPWDEEAVMPATCPNNQPPAETRAVWCQATPGPGDYSFRASWSTATSSFVASTCGGVFRTCLAQRNPTDPGPWACPCDPTKYACVSGMFEL